MNIAEIRQSLVTVRDSVARPEMIVPHRTAAQHVLAGVIDVLQGEGVNKTAAGSLNRTAFTLAVGDAQNARTLLSQTPTHKTTQDIVAHLNHAINHLALVKN